MGGRPRVLLSICTRHRDAEPQDHVPQAVLRQTGALVDEVGHFGTPVAGAQATALTAENAEKKTIK